MPNQLSWGMESGEVDRLYTVKWDQGAIAVHASSKKEAKAIALEYIYAKDVLQADGDAQEIIGLPEHSN